MVLFRCTKSLTEPLGEALFLQNANISIPQTPHRSQIANSRSSVAARAVVIFSHA